MNTPPVGIERRIGQRFAFNLPVALRNVATDAEGLGFTQDVSSRGAFLFTEMPLTEGAEVELTLKMPGEITLGDDMRVRCRGRVLRIVRNADGRDSRSLSTGPDKNAEAKIGAAVCLSCYEYLPAADEQPAEFRRIAALHTHAEVPNPAPTVLVPRASNS